jgi:hypothetical protein
LIVVLGRIGSIELKLLTRLKFSLSRVFELKQKKEITYQYCTVLYLSHAAGGLRQAAITVSDRRISLMLRVA